MPCFLATHLIIIKSGHLLRFLRCQTENQDQYMDKRISIKVYVCMPNSSEAKLTFYHSNGTFKSAVDLNS